MATAARILGQAEFGAFSYGLALSLLVMPLTEWGFDLLLVRRASADTTRLPPLLSSSLAWKTALGVVMFTAVFVLASGSRETRAAVIVLALMLAAGLVRSWGNTYRASAAALQRQTGVALALSAERILTAALALIVLLGGAGVVALASVYFAGTVLGTAATAMAAGRVGAPRLPGPVGLSGMRDLISGSFLIGASAAVAMLLFRVDMVIIELVLGDEAVAAYAVAYRLLEAVLFLCWSLTRAVFPVMSASTTSWQVRRGFEQSMAVAAIAYVPFAVVALVEAAGLIGLVFGSTYAEQSASALHWLAPAPLLFAFSYFASHVLFSGGRDTRALVTNTIATGANIGLNFVAIPRMGIAGAAMVTTATLGLRAVVGLVMARPVMGWPRWNRMLLDSALAGGALAVLVGLLQAPILVELGLGAVVYLGVWYLVARHHTPEHLRVISRVAARARP